MKTVIVALFCCVLCHAETNTIPLLKIGDRTYTNATIRKVNATTVMLHYDGGIGSAAITNLPSPYRERFMDADEMRREAESEAAAKARAAQARRDAVSLQAESVRRKAELSRERSILVRVDSVKADGFLGTVIVVHQIREAPHRILTEDQRAGAYIGSPPIPGRLIREEKEQRQSVFVSNGPRDVADGKEVYVKGWMIGTKSIDGKTVEHWDCLPSWQRH